MIINPFSVQSIYEKTCANSFAKIDKVKIYGSDEDRNTPAKLKNDYYISTCAHIMRKNDGKMQSPILDEKDVNAVAENMLYLTRSSVIMAWAFIPIPLSGVFIPIVVTNEISIIQFLALPFLVAGFLFIVSQINFWKFFFKQKELGNRLWKRGGFASIPKGFRKWQLKQSAKLWSGPASAVLLDHAIEIIPNDQIKLMYEAANLALDLADITKKKD